MIFDYGTEWCFCGEKSRETDARYAGGKLPTTLTIRFLQAQFAAKCAFSYNPAFHEAFGDERLRHCSSASSHLENPVELVGGECDCCGHRILLELLVVRPFVLFYPELHVARETDFRLSWIAFVFYRRGDDSRIWKNDILLVLFSLLCIT